MIGSKGVPDERESVELVQADPESLGAGIRSWSVHVAYVS